jgi:hypothetical protein
MGQQDEGRPMIAVDSSDVIPKRPRCRQRQYTRLRLREQRRSQADDLTPLVTGLSNPITALTFACVVATAILLAIWR